ncbi:hypothetical protein WN943_010522 [Citrus x changshan-huyou]
MTREIDESGNKGKVKSANEYREGLVQSFNRHLIRVKDKLADKKGKVWKDLYLGSSFDSDDGVYKELSKAINRLEDAIKFVGIPSKRVVQNCFALEDSENEDEHLRHISDNDDEIEGYDLEYVQPEVYDNFSETSDLL